jgi:RNA polymerase sigma-70 factor, ECF subfamily
MRIRAASVDWGVVMAAMALVADVRARLAPDMRRVMTERRHLDIHAAFRAHGPSVLGYAVNVLGEPQLAEDALQETFARAWRWRDRFDPERGSARTWLFAIARNVLADTLRARSRLPRALADSETDAIPAEEPDVSARLSLLAALAQLDEGKRGAVVAIHLEGLSYAEYSAACGVPVPTLRTRVFYGLRELRAALHDAETDHDR